jgi:hypothetical protein
VSEVSTQALQDAIHSLHGCESRHVESVPIVETFESVTVWAGAVQVFDLIDCPEATRAYAWTGAVDGAVGVLDARSAMRSECTPV